MEFNNSKIKIVNIKNSPIIKNILTMASGNVIGYIINALALPIIGRVYTKGDIGHYDLLVSSASFFITVFMLSLTLVIMIPEDDYDANSICKIALFSTLIGTFFLFLVLYLIRNSFTIVNINDSYPKALVLICIYIVSNNVQTIYYSYLNRKAKFKLLFWIPVIIALVNSAISIILGINGLRTSGYMIGTISGNIVVIIFMSFFVHPFQYNHSIHVLFECLKKYKQFPLVQLPANFIELLAIQLPVQFFGREYSAEILGGYTMACKLLTMPVLLIATPINRVYYKELVDRIRLKRKADEFVLKIIKVNYIFIAIPIGILMIFGTPIVKIFLGSEWIESGAYITIIGFAFIIKFCTQCVSGTFIATKHTNISMIYAVGTFFQYGLCFFIAHILSWEFELVMVLHTINTIINGFICLELVNICVGGKKLKISKVMLMLLSISIVIIVVFKQLYRFIGFRI